MYMEHLSMIDGKTYCQPCNDELFKSKCENCKKPITGPLLTILYFLPK